MIDNTLSLMANSPKPLPQRFGSKDGFSRNDVVNAFHRAFQLIGGVERLTMWAHENPGDFFKLYAKLLPATTVNIGDSGKLIIEHAIPRTALDHHEVIDATLATLTEDQILEMTIHADS